MQLFDSDQSIQRFAYALGTQQVGRNIVYRSRTGSTNDLALQAAREGAPHGTLFIADVQESGRGRRGRAWESPAGLGLLFSVLIRPVSIQPADIGWIPLLAGLASVDGIFSACALNAQIKWPNDIVIPAARDPGWRKLGGVLCESVLRPTGLASDCGYVVIGIGLNINHQAVELPVVAKAPPTSLRIEKKSELDRLSVLREILRLLEQRCLELSLPHSRAALKSEIESRLRQWWSPREKIQAQVRVPDGEITVSGSYAGLDDFGRLKLLDASGREHLLADAEIISVMP